MAADVSHSRIDLQIQSMPHLDVCMITHRAVTCILTFIIFESPLGVSLWMTSSP